MLTLQAFNTVAMRRVTAAITAVGGYVPNYILTNQELEKMVDTSDEWIVTRTGIKERRILKEPGKGSIFMAEQAIADMMSKKDIDPSTIDCLICCTVTPDTHFPDNANTITTNIGAGTAWGFDLNAACSGFLYGLQTAAAFIESGRFKKILVVGTDMMSSIVNYEDRSTCIIFGDGAGCVMMEPNEEGLGFQDSILRGDGTGREYLYMPAGGSLMPASHKTVDEKQHYAIQIGRPVFKAAVEGMSTTIREVLSRNDLEIKDIDWLVPHQANIRIIQAVTQAADFPMEKTLVNIEKYGNTTAGTLPLCLWDFENKFKKGDNLLFTAFGGGFTWGTIYLKWAY